MEGMAHRPNVHDERSDGRDRIRLMVALQLGG